MTGMLVGVFLHAQALPQDRAKNQTQEQYESNTQDQYRTDSLVQTNDLSAQGVASQPFLLASAILPDAPGVPAEATAASSSMASSPDNTFVDFGAQGASALPVASHTQKYIEPGQSAPSLSAGDKFLLGVKDAVSPFSAIGWVITAGYDQVTNGSPNYGTNSKAFAQRFGAAVARDTSEGIFSDSVMAPILHEDPRYYRMGSGNNFFKRVVYAGTRTIITRTDGGRTTPNFALLAGNLGGAYLTRTYYPPLNQTNSENLKTFGSSIGGSALGFLVSEFFTGSLLHPFSSSGR